MPGARRRGGGVRARSPVQRLDGRARCVRRVAGARSGGPRAAGRRPRARRDPSLAASVRRRARGVGGRRALPQPSGDPHAARAAGRRPSARARAGRPALERRRIDRADRRAAAARSRVRRSSSRSPSGRARRPAGCRPRSRCPRSAASRSASSARRRRGSCWAISQPGAVAAIYRHGGGNPFYLEQLARAGEDAWRHRAPGRQRSGKRGSRRRRGVARRGARVPVGEAARAAGCRRRRRRAVRGRPRGRDRGAVRAPTGSRRSTGSWRSISCVRPRCRGASSSATRSCAARSSSRRRVAGSSRRTPGPRPRWPPAAPRRPSARTTSSTPRAQATRRRSRCSWRQARRRRRVLRPSLPTGSKRRCGCCRPRTASGRWMFGSTSPGRCARSASSSAAGRRSWTRWHCFPPTRRRAGST